MLQYPRHVINDKQKTVTEHDVKLKALSPYIPIIIAFPSSVGNK